MKVIIMNEPKLDEFCITYGNKNILVRPYIYERERYIFDLMSKLYQMKSFLQKEELVCYNSRDEEERAYLIKTLDEYIARAHELLK